MGFIYATKMTNVRHAQDLELIDVSVTFKFSTAGNKKKSLTFSFSASIKEKAFKKAERLLPVIDTDCPERIYFFIDNSRGYKLSHSDKCGTRYYLMPSSLTELLPNPQMFVGDYDLKFNPLCDMWYIDSTEKIKI